MTLISRVNVCSSFLDVLAASVIVQGLMEALEDVLATVTTTQAAAGATPLPPPVMIGTRPHQPPRRLSRSMIGALVLVLPTRSPPRLRRSILLTTVGINQSSDPLFQTRF